MAYLLVDVKITKINNPVNTIKAIKKLKREYLIDNIVSYQFSPNAFAVKEYRPISPYAIIKRIPAATMASIRCTRIYSSATLGFIFPSMSISTVIAGLTWQPEIPPIAYTIESKVKPSENAIPKDPI